MRLRRTLSLRTLEHSVHNLIARTGRRLEPPGVQDLNVAPLTINQIASLERIGRQGDSCSAYAVHMRQKLMRQGNIIRPHTITSHQQPNYSVTGSSYDSRRSYSFCGRLASTRLQTRCRSVICGVASVGIPAAFGTSMSALGLECRIRPGSGSNSARAFGWRGAHVMASSPVGCPSHTERSALPLVAIADG
jgi:hypothetical protein